MKCVKFTMLFIVSMCAMFSATSHAITLVDQTCRDLGEIPDAWIQNVKDDLHIAYQHTSHGSQLISGMNALMSYGPFGDKYEWTDNGTAGLDLDDNGIPGACSDLSTGDWIDEFGVTPWVTATRNLLNNPANSHINVVMWSWCSINGHNAQRYVDNMEILVAQYPNIKFVFMTGHSEGEGEDMTPNGIHYNNQLIRQHCQTHDRILYDFASIEAYDPDGNYYWDQDMFDNLDYGPGRMYNWAVEWIAANPGSQLDQIRGGCTECAHSDLGEGHIESRLNCVLKGQAAWWLYARLAGWPGPDIISTPATSLWGNLLLVVGFSVVFLACIWLKNR